MNSFKLIYAVFKRELRSYFQSPVAYVFLVSFLLLIGFLTFSAAQFYERQTADLQSFFIWHPWVYLLLVPAATMGLWAEERRRGSIELLITMPITMLQATIGKFLAAWTFIIIALFLTFPVVITVLYLGSPDLGAILCGYLGSALLAGACVSIGMFSSSITKSQVISFVIALVFCLILLLAGWPPVINFFVKWAPNWLIEAVASVSLMPYFEYMQRGVLDFSHVIYYVSVMLFMTAATLVLLENRKSA